MYLSPLCFWGFCPWLMNLFVTEETVPVCLCFSNWCWVSVAQYMCIQSWHLELWVTPGGLFRLSLYPVFFVKLVGALWFLFSSGVSGGYHFLFKPLPCFLQWPQAWHYFSSLLKSALSGILQSSWSLRPASPLGQKGCAPAPGLKGRQLPISPWVTCSTSGHDREQLAFGPLGLLLPGKNLGIVS